MPAGVRYPTPPAPGEPIRATLLRDIIDCLKRITPLAGKNTTVDYGSYGARVDGTPGGKGGGVPADNSCFAIKSVTQQEKEEGETLKFTVEFRNKYASVGGKTYDFESLGPIEDVEEDSIVALKISAETPDVAELDKFESIYALQNEQNTQENLYVIPLYKFGPGGSVKCDFRNMPLSAMGEF